MHQKTATPLLTDMDHAKKGQEPVDGVLAHGVPVLGFSNIPVLNGLQQFHRGKEQNGVAQAQRSPQAKSQIPCHSTSQQKEAKRHFSGVTHLPAK